MRHQINHIGRKLGHFHHILPRNKFNRNLIVLLPVPGSQNISRYRVYQISNILYIHTLVLFHEQLKAHILRRAYTWYTVLYIIYRGVASSCSCKGTDRTKVSTASSSSCPPVSRDPMIHTAGLLKGTTASCSANGHRQSSSVACSCTYFAHPLWLPLNTPKSGSEKTNPLAIHLHVIHQLALHLYQCLYLGGAVSPSLNLENKYHIFC